MTRAVGLPALAYLVLLALLVQCAWIFHGGEGGRLAIGEEGDTIDRALQVVSTQAPTAVTSFLSTTVSTVPPSTLAPTIATVAPLTTTPTVAYTLAPTLFNETAGPSVGASALFTPAPSIINATESPTSFNATEASTLFNDTAGPSTLPATASPTMAPSSFAPSTIGPTSNISGNSTIFGDDDVVLADVTGQTSSTVVAGAAAVAVVGTLAAALSSGVGGAAAAVGGVGGAGGGAAAISGQGAGAGQSATTAAAATSSRTPATSLGVLAVCQLQFMATLQYIDPGNQAQVLADFSQSLSWSNLWWNTENVVQNDGQSSCWDIDEEHNRQPSIFIGNSILVVGLLLLIVLIHVIVISIVEARWLAHDTATVTANAVMKEGMSVEELERRVNEFESNGRSGIMPRSGGPTEAELTEGQEEEEDEDGDVNGNGNGNGNGPQDTHMQTQPMSRTQHVRNSVYNIEHQDVLELMTRRSEHFWLYMPHIELMYLLFVFEGSTLVQSRMLDSACKGLQITAIILFLLIPLLMLSFACLFYRSHVKASPSIQYIEVGPDKRGFCAKMWQGWQASWKEGESVFAVWDNGAWSSVEGGNERKNLKNKQLRIGLMPLYIDYRRTGAFYLPWTLIRLLALGLIGGLLMDQPQVQTLSLFALFSADACIILVFRPFSNGAINFFTSMTVILDMASAALLVASTQHNGLSDTLQLTVVYMQAGSLLFLTVPMYLDNIFAAKAWLMRRSERKEQERANDVPAAKKDKETVKEFVRLRTKTTWRRHMCNLIGRNLALFKRNYRRGIYAKAGPPVPPPKESLQQVGNGDDEDEEDDVLYVKRSHRDEYGSDQGGIRTAPSFGGPSRETPSRSRPHSITDPRRAVIANE